MKMFWIWKVLKLGIDDSHYLPSQRLLDLCCSKVFSSTDLTPGIDSKNFQSVTKHELDNDFHVNNCKL